MARFCRGLPGVVASCGLLALATAASAATAANAGQRSAAPLLDLPFVANAGPHPATFAFSVRSPVGTTFVTRDGALVHTLAPARRGAADGMPAGASRPGDSTGWALVERFVGGDTAAVRGGVPAAFPVGAVDADGSVRALQAFETLALPRLYPGIDLTLARSRDGTERVYRVRPGADPGRIAVEFAGAEGLLVAADGRLLIATPAGTLAQSRPVAWQQTPHGRNQVAVRYRVEGPRYGFELARYDRTRALYIDPVLVTTYLGGSGNDAVGAVAVHPATGEIYAMGSTGSINFPGIAGGAVPIEAGGVFVARFDATLRSLLQATLLPGTFTEGRNLAIHPASGEIYALWRAAGSLPGAADCQEVFIGRLTADLRSLSRAACYSFFRSAQHDASGIAIGPGGDVYISGTAYLFGGGDATPAFRVFGYPFTVRFGPDLGVQLGTYYGGGGAIAIHPASGEVYALNKWGPPQVVRLTPAFVEMGTLPLGPRSHVDIAIHPATGQVYVLGSASDGAVPGTAGGVQPAPAGGYDAFVSRIAANLYAVLQSTYVGGTLDDHGTALAIDSVSGDVFVTGNTRSTDLPGTAGSAQPALAGGVEGFVARLAPSLTVRRRATYVGGSGDDLPTALALHAVTGELVVAGGTASPDLAASGGSALPALRGASDGFLVRITASLSGAGGVAVIGGSGQRAPTGGPFARPLVVRVVDTAGVPVAGIAVTFAMPATGASATFRAGGTHAVVTTTADGLATSPPFSANGQPGTYVATAATPTGESATFDLGNDATVTEIPAWGALGQLLTVLGVIVLASARLRRRDA